MTSKRFEFDNVTIEVTRKCNAKCEHCLRGDAENLNMPLRYVESLFKKTSRIHSICFTGGEPSLAVQTLLNILMLAKVYEVEIGNFYIATNAIKVTDSFLMACIKWYLYCDDNEISQVQWSNDLYHSIPLESVKKLKTLSFASAKYSKETLDYEVIAEGKAKDMSERKTSVDAFELEVEDDSVRVMEGNVYLNCKGHLVSGCDWSFKSQERVDRL